MIIKGIKIPPLVCDMISNWAARVFKNAVLDFLCPGKERYYTFSGWVYEANRISDI